MDIVSASYGCYGCDKSIMTKTNLGTTRFISACSCLLWSSANPYRLVICGGYQGLLLLPCSSIRTRAVSCHSVPWVTTELGRLLLIV